MQLPSKTDTSLDALPFVDTNGDGLLSPIDVLVVINELQREPIDGKEPPPQDSSAVDNNRTLSSAEAFFDELPGFAHVSVVSADHAALVNWTSTNPPTLSSDGPSQSTNSSPYNPDVALPVDEVRPKVSHPVSQKPFDLGSLIEEEWGTPDVEAALSAIANDVATAWG